MALDKLQHNEPCFFGGDLNESFWPKKVLLTGGFEDCFSALSLPQRATHPARPSVAHEDFNSDAVLDWLFARPSGVGEGGASGTGHKTVLASVIKDMRGLSSDDSHEKHILAIQPSDHCPVMAVYRF